jgi:putative photosynthetic complex assembly protein 2
VLVLALAGLAWSNSRTTELAAYISFTCGLLAYAWLELTYYMGFVTGPKKDKCAPGCSGWPHFIHAIQANFYHEVLVIAGAGVVTLISLGGENRIGMWTYLLLWGMQLSARLNVFLGVRNLSEEFLPAHMEHMKSFFRQKPMNLLFPFSVVLGTVLTVWLMEELLAAELNSYAAYSWVFLASMSALAVVEHWFLVLPLPVTALWQWWLEKRDGVKTKAGTSAQAVGRVKLGSMAPITRLVKAGVPSSSNSDP